MMLSAQTAGPVRDPQAPLTDQEIAQFHEHGFVFVEGFYDAQHDIRPIQHAIYRIVGLLVGKYGLDIARPPFSPATFDAGFQELIAHDRAIGGEVYDAVKQIPAFIRLLGAPENVAAFGQLRGTHLPGIAGQGSGIRIDNPGEVRFMAPWHQEYPAQFRSLDGAVFWSPLKPMTRSLGPVEICVGSHKEGLVRVTPVDRDNREKTGAYALRLEDEGARVARYERLAPLSRPGDLLIMDFLTIHRSGANVSRESRWSMQFRYFNFREPTGLRLGWPGSFAAGKSIAEIHPELLADAPERSETT